MSGDLIQCAWTGTAFVPQTPFMLRRAREAFGEGEIVLLHVENERSMRSHRHYFAALHDLWLNLPERYADAPWAQSAEHLRRYALIKTGFSDSQSYPCKTDAEAMRWASNIRPLDEFGVVVREGAVVVRYTAKSQSVKAMGKADFQRSKDAVLGFCEALVGVAA